MLNVSESFSMIQWLIIDSIVLFSQIENCTVLNFVHVDADQKYKYIRP